MAVDNQVQSFKQFSFSSDVLAAIRDLEFKIPTPIQSKAIPVVLSHRDILATAQTGTGKTAAFCLPILQTLLKNPEKSALILTPTREISTQIMEFLKQVVPEDSGISMGLLIGGLSMNQQLRALANQPRILVATPGRLTDHLRRRNVSLKSSNILVLDEADHMLEMGFGEALNDILYKLPKHRQTLMFSATIRPNTEQLATRFLHKPIRISVGSTVKPVSKIEQKNVQISMEDKFDRLMDELNSRKGSVLIFVRTRVFVEKLAKQLLEYGYQVRRLHGERTQFQRNKAVQDFKEGTCRILVATDVAARGIDIPGISHVFNYDPPQSPDDYVHRLGRTARAGESGKSLNFVTPENENKWSYILGSSSLPQPNPQNKMSARSRGKKKPFPNHGKSNFSGKKKSSKKKSQSTSSKERKR